MVNLILDERDQKFILYELLDVMKLCNTAKYADFTEDIFNMILTEARKLATEEIFPTLTKGDKEGCRLENGQVMVPTVFHKPYKRFCEGGWIGLNKSQDVGGQGLPLIIANAAKDWFRHNFAFTGYPGIAEGAASIIEIFGTEAQKKKYVGKMNTGEWGGSMCMTEPSAGTDVGAIETKAIRQTDGTFRLQGTKIFISCGDHDLVSNIIHPVLARIEGDPAGTRGISIFLVPKFFVNDDGSLGKRNDYMIGGIEHKMGIHGSSTCLINFGDNNECYAELLGEERQGMKIMFQLIKEARIEVGFQGLASGSIAYMHAVQYAKERLQGSSLLEMKNPNAPRVPIIQHPDVRRMLLWMKAQVEGMRALMYYASYCVDMEETTPDETLKEKYHGLLKVLTPICKAYCSDMAFRVTELAIQVYGGYGYCSDYPVEQFMRDAKIASIYEGTNGIQAVDLVGRKLRMKGGAYFMSLLDEMNATVIAYQGNAALKDLARDVQNAVNKLSEVAMYFAGCAKTGEFLVPVCNAYPFLMLMGKVVVAWLLLWEAGVAWKRLECICSAKEIAPSNARKLNALAKEDADTAFYIGKVAAARYFIKHVLPEVDAAVTAIKSEDLSMMDIPEEAFVL